MSRRIVVIGAGGFGRETLDVIDAINGVSETFELAGVVDDAPSDVNLKRLAARGTDYLGPLGDWLAAGDDAEFVVGIGSPKTRQAVAERVEAAGFAAATLVHPRAGLGSVMQLGPGTIVCAGAELSTNVRSGRHVHVNPHATIGHDTVLGDFVSINPAATVSGECVIEERVLIGAAAVILQGRHVHSDAVVGAAACVVTAVPAGATVKGVPAR